MAPDVTATPSPPDRSPTRPAERSTGAIGRMRQGAAAPPGGGAPVAPTLEAASPIARRVDERLPDGFYAELSVHDLGLLLRLADECFTTEGLPPYRPS